MILVPSEIPVISRNSSVIFIENYIESRFFVIQKLFSFISLLTEIYQQLEVKMLMASFPA